MNRAIRVLVADDSRAVRQALIAALSADPSFEVVGEAADGLEAVEGATSVRPDVITMDVLMPGLDGLKAIQAIMSTAPARIVVVTSAVSDHELNVSFRAIEAGALEVLAKPAGPRAADFDVWSRRLRQSVRLMAGVPVVRRPARRDSEGSVGRGSGPVVLPALGTRRLAAFALGASTGGPAALAHVIGRLPRGFPAPVLVAQHMAPGFSRGLVRWLADVSALNVLVVEKSVPAMPACVYLPTGSHDLTVDADGVLHAVASRADPCPSVDRLFESVATAYGRRAGAAVLTGMGDDGARGLLALRRAGGATLCQDEASSVVFGMPKAAIALDAAEHVLPLAAISGAITALCGVATTSGSGESA